ncbi:hypothetical protein CLUG_02284 [Clavispora lusitaniae ATCC 42720]|uniref:Uncharacterized protein n=1 Tax=Clavispora lusitaniae (strain ATCC 42720) TaxID=306902 RepID=C4Y252_CLAL4|nr:uncharacterized protein CLUG_02284 [Clavispora lusitaniae ATCC 42720]EEQ38161.1 hypothetical protein CLUG_02284 [Clavispora lusitaniae ATCC 42720]
MVELSVTVPGNISGGASHVKADQRNVVLWIVAGFRVSNNTTRRAGKNSSQAREGRSINQSTVRLHKVAPDSVGFLFAKIAVHQASFETGQVFSDFWSQVRIHNRRVGSGNVLDHGAQLGRKRNVGKANLTSNFTHKLLVVWECVGMHQTNANGADARLVD